MSKKKSLKDRRCPSCQREVVTNEIGEGNERMRKEGEMSLLLTSKEIREKRSRILRAPTKPEWIEIKYNHRRGEFFAVLMWSGNVSWYPCQRSWREGEPNANAIVKTKEDGNRVQSGEFFTELVCDLATCRATLARYGAGSIRAPERHGFSHWPAQRVSGDPTRPDLFTKVGDAMSKNWREWIICRKERGKRELLKRGRRPWSDHCRRNSRSKIPS